MSGSVWEWLADDYDNPDQHRPDAAERILRGGDWSNNADYCRVSVRFWLSPGSRVNYLGLRLSRSLD